MTIERFTMIGADQMGEAMQLVELVRGIATDEATLAS